MKKRLSDYEVSKCRNSLKTLREKALLELMLSAGPRVGEICNLKIENLDFERGEINIYGEKTSKWRVCFMTPDCRVALEQYINGRTEGYIFLNSRNEVTGKQLCKATIEEIAKEIAERAGCKCVATVHVYRKTFASREYARTNDILYVSRRLGHANTAVTERYYVCDDVDRDRRIASIA